MKILIQNTHFADGSQGDVAIHGNRIQTIGPNLGGDYDTVIDGTHRLAIPPFYNTHCHAAMTLLRGIADDMELFDWLSNHIWPAEAKLNAHSIYAGTKLAVLEMIKSGTVFFNDMYFHPAEIVRAVDEMGIRAAVGLIELEAAPPEVQALHRRNNAALLERRNDFTGRIQLAYSPHAIYTVGEPTLRRIAEDSARTGLRVHIHLAETDQEVADCRKQHGGLTPAAYLETLGLLNDRLLAAHSIHLDDADIAMLVEHGVNFSYMPCSNYKLSSGKFRFRKISDAGGKITFGTDGCASNNNLSMFDEMKFGALGAKIEFGGPTACSAARIFTAATRAGAEAFGIDGGTLEAGKLADIVLLDYESSLLVADHNQISNVVYSADSSCVETVLCDGRILMRDRVVPGEAEIVAEARAEAARLRG